MKNLQELVNESSEIAVQMLGPTLAKELREKAVIQSSHLVSQLVNAQRNKKAGRATIADCTPESLAQVLLDVLTMDLSLSPSLGLGYIIPYNVNNELTAIFQTSWKGDVTFFQQNGVIVDCFSNVVYEKDEFDFEEKNGEFDYTFKPAIGDRGKRVGAYACFLMPDGRIRGGFYNLSDIQKRRQVAKTDKIWTAWFDEMVRKTVIRMAMATLPRGRNTQEVFSKWEEVDNRHLDISQELTEEKREEVILKIREYVLNDDPKGLRSYHRGLSAIAGHDGAILDEYEKAFKSIRKARSSKPKQLTPPSND